MNQSFSSLFKNRVSPIVLPRGFKLYKRIYYRVINGVLQCFTLERFDTMLHVRFSLAPICLSMDKEEFVNFPLRDLSQYVDPPQGCCWWSTDDWTETLDKMADGIQNFLLPLFDGATSAKAAYEAMIRCDMQVYKRWMNSFSYVVFNIIAGDYETAEKHMQAIIEAYSIPRPAGRSTGQALRKSVVRSMLRVSIDRMTKMLKCWKGSKHAILHTGMPISVPEVTK